MKSTGIQFGILSYINKHLYPVIVIVIFFLSLVTDWYIPLAQLFFYATIIMLLDRLGKGIVLRELIALHAILICIFMPTLGYLFYNRNDHLARLWQRYMPIPVEVYFGFALPAICAFVLALCWPIYSPTASDQNKGVFDLIDRAKAILKKNPKPGIYLMVIGVLCSFLTNLFPASIRFIVVLLYWCSFTGCMYIYYTSGLKFRKYILAGFAMFVVYNSIKSAFFTEVAYMGITLFSFFFLGKKFALWKKMVLFAAAVFLLILIQGVKQNYRRLTWKGKFEGNQVALFGRLIAEKFQNTDNFFAQDAFFPIYYRANQGFNVSLVMRRIPSYQDYDRGAQLSQVILSSFVPRVLWPNKPEAGGRANMLFYTGVVIEGWSTNVGPLGEAYGSFGVTGGIIYMFFLGFLIRWSYKRMFQISYRRPLVLFWLPVIFYMVTYSSESDTLQILNSLVKSAFFVWVLYKIAPRWFGVIKNRVIRQPKIPRIANPEVSS
jgi:hypothetical protein